jgi:hypothetical protein
VRISADSLGYRFRDVTVWEFLPWTAELLRLVMVRDAPSISISGYIWVDRPSTSLLTWSCHPKPFVGVNEKSSLYHHMRCIGGGAPMSRRGRYGTFPASGISSNDIRLASEISPASGDSHLLKALHESCVFIVSVACRSQATPSPF